MGRSRLLLRRCPAPCLSGSGEEGEVGLYRDHSLRRVQKGASGTPVWMGHLLPDLLPNLSSAVRGKVDPESRGPGECGLCPQEWWLRVAGAGWGAALGSSWPGICTVALERYQGAGTTSSPGPAGQQGRLPGQVQPAATAGVVATLSESPHRDVQGKSSG